MRPRHDSSAPVFVVVGFGSTLVLALVVFLVLAFWPFKTAGTVTQVNWTHRVDVEKFVQVAKEDWAANLVAREAIMPVDGRGEDPGCFNFRDCRRRYHHTERYRCGSHEVCTTDRETGKRRCRTETEYCTEEVYRQWCTYDTYDWRVVDSRAISGVNPGEKDPMAWPGFKALPLTREVRHAEYTADVSYGSGRSTWRELNGQEVRAWMPGDAVTVKHSLTHVVYSVSRP